MRAVVLAWLAATLWAKTPAPTFAHDVAPILYQHCAECHHAGAVAPFPLLTYADASKRAALIATVTAARYMPPWLPSAPHFQRERHLSANQIAILQQWAAAGAPQGNPEETPVPPVFKEGWPLGPPGLEAQMPKPFPIPADGPDLYRCFVIPLPAGPERYVKAIDIRPGNSRVVHHALLFQDVARQARRRDTGDGYSCFGTPGFLPARGLGGWTPGKRAVFEPPGMAENLYPRADLVLQVHYHPTGKPETDQTRVALYFTPEKPRRHLSDIALGSNRIDIPAGDAAYKVMDHFTLPVDVEIFGVIPHAHYVCRDMLGYAILPSGERRTLIHIPNWDFNWQDQYRYPVPLRLPADTRIIMEFTYDNSEQNQRNPNHPPRRVVYGPATTDEMAGLHLEAVPVRDSDEEELGASLWGKFMRSLGGGIYRRPQ